MSTRCRYAQALGSRRGPTSGRRRGLRHRPAVGFSVLQCLWPPSWDAEACLACCHYPTRRWQMSTCGAAVGLLRADNWPTRFVSEIVDDDLVDPARSCAPRQQHHRGSVGPCQNSHYGSGVVLMVARAPCIRRLRASAPARQIGVRARQSRDDSRIARSSGSASRSFGRFPCSLARMMSSRLAARITKASPWRIVARATSSS